MLWALVASILVAGCGEEREIREWTPEDHVHPARVDPNRVPQGSSDVNEPQGSNEERAAAALWLVSCATCHGREGRGDGPARPPNVEMKDLTDPTWHAETTDEQIAQVILEGRGEMQGFGDRINPRGIAALVGHIRRMNPQAVEEEEPQEPEPQQEQPQQEQPPAPTEEQPRQEQPPAPAEEQPRQEQPPAPAEEQPRQEQPPAPAQQPAPAEPREEQAAP